MSAELWSEEELGRVLGAPSAPLAATVRGVSIDTRTLSAGDLFFAIKGDTHDGHDHVARAFAAGASAAVVLRERAPALAAEGPVFAVEETLRAMERLGQAARARSSARIVAVTGSVGKTSEKEMLRLALSKQGATHASAASYNNHWGVPLTLSRLPADAAFAVFEIGMNHAGEIAPLVGFVRPHVAIITTIAPVHIENLGTIEAIADAKAEIFSGMGAGGVAVLNRDAPQFHRLERQALARGLAVRASAPARAATPGSSVSSPAKPAPPCARSFRVARSPSSSARPGRHMAENAVGALAVVEALGASVESAAAAFAEFAPPKGRGERIALPAPGGPFIVIDESYNANPASMRAALALLGATRPGLGRSAHRRSRRHARTRRRGRLHARGARARTGEAKVELLFGAGPLTRALYEAAPASLRAGWSERSSEIRDALVGSVRAGDVVMIKGSNGSRMGPLVQALRETFSSTGRRDRSPAC